ncbi:RegA protein [Caulobacter phage Cr30]|uniref:translation repressor n=1 Tax=Caulobacter phage Cr30 TaxID=1357714 RepID=UPI0004A9B513|nr:translation repressor [Caulobacter phage Cr30]AGS81019.1 RegA protein [Caulobacter phage Cr30]
MTNQNKSVEELLESFIEIELSKPEDFLIVKETLERIGISSSKTTPKTLYPSCVILFKRGRYWLLHFKECFMLDRKPTSFSEEDRKRRNTIAWLLNEWGLVTVKNTEVFKDLAPISSIKVVPSKEKKEFQIIHKYVVGKN